MLTASVPFCAVKPGEDGESVWDRGPDLSEILSRMERLEEPDPLSTARPPRAERTAAPIPTAVPAGSTTAGARERLRPVVVGAVCVGLAIVAVLAYVLTRSDSDPVIVGARDGPSPVGAASMPAPASSVEAAVALSTVATSSLLPATPPPATTQPPSTTSLSAAPASIASASLTTVEQPPVAAPAASLPPSSPQSDGPRVVIVGREGPCRFGSDCLIVGFSIEGFDTQPTEFVCEFGDGSRFTFRFESLAVEHACATSGAAASITVEVDGVRSDTATRSGT